VSSIKYLSLISMFIAIIWFCLSVSALIVGMFLKKSSIIEKGPTGALAEVNGFKLSDSDIASADIAHRGPLEYIREGCNLLQSGNFEEAISTFTSAINLQSDDCNAYFNRGVAYTKIKQNKNALNDLKMAAKLGHPKSIQILKSKGIPV
jgi:tetratricopeptide (TPR) repeat protein